jgi:DNA-binding NarL/FixJ family response regulator
LCGDHRGQPCTLCDSILDPTPPVKKGLTVGKAIKLGKLVETASVWEGQTITTMMQPSDDPKTQQIIDQVDQTVFTPREKELVGYLLAGKTNAQIEKKWVVSKATLKTHLNHIYQKIPELRQLREALA